VKVNDPQLVDIKPVGNYALNIVWKDCVNGIYTFAYLKELSHALEDVAAQLPQG
jgi:DUF971 family protein